MRSEIYHRIGSTRHQFAHRLFSLATLMAWAFIAVGQDAPTLGECRLSADVSVYPLADGVWRYVAQQELPQYGRVPANGLIVVNEGQAVVVNLPWTNEQAALLFDWIERNRQAKVRTVIPTHSHADCAGGLEEAHRRGCDSVSLRMTADLMRADGKPIPRHTFRERKTVRCGGIRVKLLCPGSGHTRDNIVAWIPSRGVLFAGCLVKSEDAMSLGNTADADLCAYPKTLDRLKRQYPEAAVVVPGHGNPGTIALIDHTLALCAHTTPR